MSNEIKLLPCHFCGSDAFNIDDYPDDIICNTPNCIVNHVVTFGFESRKQLAERWNQREHPVPQVPTKYVWRVRWMNTLGIKKQLSRMQSDYFDTEQKAREHAEIKAILGFVVDSVKRLRIIEDDILRTGAGPDSQSTAAK